MNKTTGLVIGMLVTGTINTLLNKWQDLTCVQDCDSVPITFQQPLWQTLNMFIGEAACILVYLLSIYTSRGYTPIGEPSEPRKTMTFSSHFLFVLPTLCDLISTTLMNVGLIYISASVYQMLRGSVVLFTGSLSVLFLGVVHPLYRWFALLTVFGGVAIVGLAGSLGTQETNGNGNGNPILGTCLVILAQTFTACQFVIEEKIMLKYAVPPLKAVGLEGIFGLIGILTAMPILHFTLRDVSSHFDLVIGFHQMMVPQVLYAGIGIIFSIAFFNYFGLTVTRTLSATSRSTIDTCRTLFIWIASLILQWESFKSLQVLGFVVLVYGTFLFNDVVAPPVCCVRPTLDHDEIVVDDPIEGSHQ